MTDPQFGTIKEDPVVLPVEPVNPEPEGDEEDGIEPVAPESDDDAGADDPEGDPEAEGGGEADGD